MKAHLVAGTTLLMKQVAANTLMTSSTPFQQLHAPGPDEFHVLTGDSYLSKQISADSWITSAA